MIWQVIWTLVAATSGALIAARLNVPGGMLLGAMVGAAAVSLSSGTSGVSIPKSLNSVALVLVGTSIGVQVNRETLKSIGALVVPAVAAALALILVGVGVAWLLVKLGVAPPGVALATSPGALAAMTAAALDQGVGAVEVAMFHFIRLVLTILSLPFLLRILE